MELFGRNTDVEVEYIQIKKMDSPVAEDKAEDASVPEDGSSQA